MRLTDRPGDRVYPPKRGQNTIEVWCGLQTGLGTEFIPSERGQNTIEVWCGLQTGLGKISYPRFFSGIFYTKESTKPIFFTVVESMRLLKKSVITIAIAAMLLASLVASLPLSSGAAVAELPAPVAQVGSYKVFLPSVQSAPVYIPTGEWNQHAHDALRTSYSADTITTPLRWKWAWNGPNASGGVISGKVRLVRNSQPVTGGGRVYIAAGNNGVYAINDANGTQAWNSKPGGAINSTPAYDAATDSLFVVSSNGYLYRLSASTGSKTGEYNGGAAISLPLPPALYGGKVYFSMGSQVFAIYTSTMQLAWSYNAGTTLNTPPAVSPATGLVVAAGENLFVHAINDSNGSRAWAVKPTTLSPGDPDGANPYAQVSYGWPVIAEVHGLVLIKLRLNWQSMWTWSPWPSTNAQMRTNLTNNPSQQALFAMRLSNGSTAFISNVGHGGFGDNNFMPMGPQPVVKRFADGSEVAYVVMRGSPCQGSPCDGRYDSHLGEMLLDSSTVSGFSAGYVRFIDNTHFPTDEQVNLSMAGDNLYGGHWMFGIAHQIINRSASRGASSDTPITTSNLPHIITSTTSCGFNSSHYCAGNMTQDGDPRTIPGGFYIYYNAGKVYDQYWTGYASWTISNGTLYYVSGDGAVVALAQGNTLSDAGESVEPEVVESAEPQVLEQPIAYLEAGQYAGSIATVEGELKYVFDNGKVIQLSFEYPHVGFFKARILKEDAVNFSAPPDTLYSIGMRVRVTGLIEWYQGDPVIYVHSPEQIEVLDAVDGGG